MSRTALYEALNSTLQTSGNDLREEVAAMAPVCFLKETEAQGSSV